MAANPCEYAHLGECRGETSSVEILEMSNGDRVVTFACDEHRVFAVSGEPDDSVDPQALWDTGSEEEPVGVPELTGIDLSSLFFSR